MIRDPRARGIGLALVMAVAAVVAGGCGGAAAGRSAAPGNASARTTPATGATTTRAACPPAGSGGGEARVLYRQLPPATRAQVDEVRAAWAHKYPTAADAVRAGWFKTTPNLFGIGSHYVKSVKGLSVAEPFDLLHPPILLYDGEGSDAKFAGVSYVVKGNVAGFSGCYDVWHTHKSVCIDRQHRITLTEPHSWLWYSESECRAHGGIVMPLAADRMLHVWIGPGYTNAPILAHDNPKLYDGYAPKRPT